MADPLTYAYKGAAYSYRPIDIAGGPLANGGKKKTVLIDEGISHCRTVNQLMHSDHDALHDHVGMYAEAVPGTPAWRLRSREACTTTVQPW